MVYCIPQPKILQGPHAETQFPLESIKAYMTAVEVEVTNNLGGFFLLKKNTRQFAGFRRAGGAVNGIRRTLCSVVFLSRVAAFFRLGVFPFKKSR